MTKIVLQFSMADFDALIPEMTFDIQSTAYAINCRYLEVENLPRTGDFIMYPIFNLLPVSVRNWMHTRIAFKVIHVIHNPIAVVPFSSSDNSPDIRSSDEFNTIVVVKPVLAHQIYGE